MKCPRRSLPRLRSSGFVSSRSKALRRPSKRLIIEPLEHRRLLAAYDISTGPNVSTPSINGGIFQSTNNKSSAGTGLIDSFLRVQATGTEQGFNTDAPVTLDAKSGNFTRSLLLSDIPLVNRPQDGVNSAQFALDIGQLSSSPLLSLDQVKIYLTDSPVLTESPGSPANFHNFGTPIPANAHVVPVYNLDANTDNYVLLSSAVAGSGNGVEDMLLYVPNSAFTTAVSQLKALNPNATPYVVLYSQFGTENATNDGPEEWAVGNGKPVTATIEGFKFNDLNGDGTFEAGEPGINGVTIFLDQNNDGMLDNGEVSTTTHTEIVNGVSHDGLYEFEGLLPDTYTVREVAPAGSTQTSTNPPALTVALGDFVLPSFDPRFVTGDTAQDLLAFGNFFVHTTTLSTTIHNAADNSSLTGSPPHAALGTSVYDSVTMGGTIPGVIPTGTLTYEFFTTINGTGSHVDQTVTLSGGAVPNSSVHGPLAAGSYSFITIYSGDSHYSGSTSAVEPLVIDPASPAISTVAGGTIVIGSGSKLTDSALLSGGFNPTGTVTFTLFNPSNVAVYTDVVTVSGNGTYTTAAGNNPGGYLPTVTGTYLWTATYSGDANNQGASDNGQNENELVSPASPAISTVAGGTIVIGSGSKLTDSALLSGAFNPTGTVTFTLFNPSNVAVYTDVVTVNGNGTYTTAAGNNPGGYLPTVTGTYLWTATYSGDANNQGASDNGQNENELVSPASPAISTVAGGTIVIGSGSKLTDSALLSGAFNPTGTVTFTLFNPSNVAVYTDVVTVNGNGTYTTAAGNNPGGYLPTVTGTYLWTATYSGDANNQRRQRQWPE